ncbi:hypothetical protein WBP06_23990 [Novosphingobium sp. BL-8H]|uniref:hypothetical protein n=1 Tax=Novosphingobium sp. BL-8H TaxID=3127640 RepID=UPI0037581C6F
MDDAAWQALERQLMEAHEQGDTAGLIGAYTKAADVMEAQNRIDAACFYLTQAYVLALEAGADELEALDQRLVAYGRN